MTTAITLAMPSWSEAANLLNAAAALLKVLVWPVFCALVLFAWRKHVASALDALIQLIPNLSEGSGPWFGFKLTERRTPPGTATRTIGRGKQP